MSASPVVWLFYFFFVKACNGRSVSKHLLLACIFQSCCSNFLIHLKCFCFRRNWHIFHQKYSLLIFQTCNCPIVLKFYGCRLLGTFFSDHLPIVLLLFKAAVPFFWLIECPAFFANDFKQVFNTSHKVNTDTVEAWYLDITLNASLEVISWRQQDKPQTLFCFFISAKSDGCNNFPNIGIRIKVWWIFFIISME